MQKFKKKFHPRKRPPNCRKIAEGIQQRPFPFRTHVCNRIRELTLSLLALTESRLFSPTLLTQWHKADSNTCVVVEHIPAFDKYSGWNSYINKRAHLLISRTECLRNSISTIIHTVITLVCVIARTQMQLGDSEVLEKLPPQIRNIGRNCGTQKRIKLRIFPCPSPYMFYTINTCTYEIGLLSVGA